MGWPELLRAARQRHGIVLLADARSHGVPERQLRDRARREDWQRLHLGVWLHPSARDTGAARHVAAAAAVPGLFRERSALYALGTNVPAPHPPQMLLPHALRSRRLVGVDVRRSRHLPAADRTTVRDADTTTVARAVADLARGTSVPGLRHLAIDLERDGHLRRPDLIACHRRLPRGTPGRGRLGQVLDELGWLRSDSDTEHDLRRALTDLGYPVHPRPFPFRCDDGLVVWLDLALPAHWVYLEVDGFVEHTRRGTFEGDRRKWTQVVRHWRPVWVTADRWRQDQLGVLRDLDATLQLADADRPPAVPALPGQLGALATPPAQPGGTTDA